MNLKNRETRWPSKTRGSRVAGLLLAAMTFSLGGCAGRNAMEASAGLRSDFVSSSGWVNTDAGGRWGEEGAEPATPTELQGFLARAAQRDVGPRECSVITPDFTWKPLAKHHGEGWGSEEEAEKIISGPDPDPDLAREFILKYTKDPRYRLSTTCYVIFAKIELKEAQRIADGIEAQDQAEAAQKRQVAEERIKQGQALAEQVTSEPDSALTFLNGPPADDDEWVMLEEFLAQSGGPDKLADGARKVAIDFAKQSQCETAADLALCERWLAVFPEHELAEGVRVKVEAVLSDNLVAYLDFSRDSWRAASKKLGTLRAEMERFTAEGRAQAQERVILKLASLNPSVDSPTQLDVEAADAVLAAVVEMGGQGSNTHKTLASKGRKLRAKHAKVAAANKRRAKADAARSGQASKKSDKVFKCTLGCITKAENRCAGKTKRGLTNPYDLCVSSYLKSCCKKCGTTINTNNYQTCFY